MIKLTALLLSAAALATPAFSQNDVKDTVLKHLKNSEDFTVKVAEAMPEADYGFKLTAPQMSFAEQMIHLSQGMTYFVSSFSGEKPNPSKPASMSKTVVIAYIRSAYEQTISKVSQVTPEQLHKTYDSDEGKLTGLELLIGLMDHTTHHRACSEMYLRVKGITPPAYEF